MHVDFAVHVYETVLGPSCTTLLIKFVIAQKPPEVSILLPLTVFLRSLHQPSYDCHLDVNDHRKYQACGMWTNNSRASISDFVRCPDSLIRAG